MQRTFKYRLYPNRKQRETLGAQLDLCRELYNAALQERIASYKTTGKGVTWLEQQAQLPSIKEVRPEFKSVHAHTLQAVLIRLNRAFQNFFRRVKNNETPGFPRFKGRNRFSSLVFTPTAFQVQGRHVAISKVGNIKIKARSRNGILPSHSRAVAALRILPPLSPIGFEFLRKRLLSGCGLRVFSRH